jgi:hypothetical protein
MYKPLLQQSLKEQERTLSEYYDRKIDTIHEAHRQELRLKEDDYTSKILWYEQRIEKAEKKEREVNEFKAGLENRAMNVATNIAESLHLCKKSERVFGEIIQDYQRMGNNIKEIAEGVKDEGKKYKGES